MPENTILKVYIIPESYINHVTSMTSKQEFRYICLYSIHMHVYTHTVLAFHFVQWRRWDILKNIYLYIYFPLKVRKKKQTKKQAWQWQVSSLNFSSLTSNIWHSRPLGSVGHNVLSLYRQKFSDGAQTPYYNNLSKMILFSWKVSV